MKKLSFALACAASIALFADEPAAPIASADFEGYTDLPAYVTGASATGDDSRYWLFEGGESAEDGSVVKAYGEGNLGVPQGESKSGTAGSNYLELSTEGGILWRSLNILDGGEGETKELGNPVAIESATGGIYIDTMVQFTATEDGAEPDLETGDGNKLALWLDKTGDGDDATYTLKVNCGHIFFDGGETCFDDVTIPLTDESGELFVRPGEWYRLTVETLKDAFGKDEGINPFFRIKLDGQTLRAAGETQSVHQDVYEGEDAWEWPSSVSAAMKRGEIFMSRGGETDGTYGITAIGFKGTGAIDDLKVYNSPVLFTPLSFDDEGEDDPETVEQYSFTIAVPTGWSAKYVIGDADPVDYTGAVTVDADQGITVTYTNPDGITKSFEAEINEDQKVFDLTDDGYAFTWADYLGDAITDGDVTYYGIDGEAELLDFAKGCATLGSANTTFKLTADITLTDPWAGIGTYNVGESADAFKGTFDGDGKTITVLFASGSSNKYRGFFNQLEGATVKNLKVSSNGGFVAGLTGEYGCALIAGHARNSTIENCTALGTVSGTHNLGGIVVRFTGSTIKNCTNEADISGNYTKLAGIAVITQSGTSTIEGCVNKGTITATNGDTSARDGLAGILAYASSGSVTIKGCVNEGNLVDNSGNENAKIAQIYACGQAGATITAGVGEYANKGTTSALALGITEKTAVPFQINGLNYATVADGVATYVADSAVAAGADLLVTAKNLAPVLVLGENETITFDTALAAINASGITAADDLELAEPEVVGTKTTYSTKAVESEPVVESIEISQGDTTTVEVDGTIDLKAVVTMDPVDAQAAEVTWTITAGDDYATIDKYGTVTGVAAGTVTVTATAGGKTDTITITVTAKEPEPDTYPAYIGAEDADAKAKFDAWVADVAGIDGRDGESAYGDAYLLNCAVADVEEAKAEFKIKSITVNADGTVTIEEPTPPEGKFFNGTVEIQGSETVNGTYAPKAGADWAEGIRFFKAVLK